MVLFILSIPHGSASAQPGSWKLSSASLSWTGIGGILHTNDTSIIASCLTSERPQTGCPQSFSPSDMPSQGFVGEYDHITFGGTSLSAAFGYTGSWTVDFSLSLDVNAEHDTCSTISYTAEASSTHGFFFDDKETYTLGGRFPVQIDSSNSGFSCRIELSGENLRIALDSIYAVQDYGYADPDNQHISELGEWGLDSLTIDSNATLALDILSNPASVTTSERTGAVLSSVPSADGELSFVVPNSRQVTVDGFDVLGRPLFHYRTTQQEFSLLLPNRAHGLVILRFIIEPVYGSRQLVYRKFILR